MSKRTNLKITPLIVSFVLLTTAPTFAGNIIYVDDDASPPGDGTSWETAFTYLQDALANALSDDEIHVAQGVYKPDEGAGITPRNREATFQLIRGVRRLTLKGGYAGAGTKDPNARNIGIYKSLLSGDLNGDDGPDFANNGENSYHVVCPGSETTLDGFIITAGNANGSYWMNRDGGGIRLFWSHDVKIYNCIIRGNTTSGFGGGIYLGDSDATLINCVFSGNQAGNSGGGLFGETSDGSTYATLTNCTFNSNSAWNECGGIHMLYVDGVTLTNCILWGNFDSTGMDELAQIYSDDIVANYSCIQGWTGNLRGISTIGADPLFVDADGADNVFGTKDDNFRLLSGSPCIDAGDNLFGIEPEDFTGPPVLIDLDGNPRIVDDPNTQDTGYGTPPVVDMGAYEFQHPCIIYVDDDATGANNGSSWTDAYNYLQDALAAAYSGDEIRVAKGIYKPDQGVGITPGDREATFQLISGVTLKGGYAGFGEPDPDARDIELYKTILSGDLDSNDVELENLEWDTIYLFVGHPSRAENSCHVATGSGTDATAVLDGVTITCGNAYGPEPGYCENKDGNLTCGAGMYNDSGSPTLTNCTFCRNTSWTIYAYSCPEDSFDAGIRDFDVSFDLTEIFMVDTSGAGIYNCNSNMTLNNCMFEENIVFGADSSSAGGGIHNVNSDIVLINCIFKTNVAAGFDSHYWGGAIANSNSNPTLEGCSFIENLAYYDSGGALTLGSSTSATLTNCKFVGNAAEDGGAICGLGQATLKNCAFHENVAYGSGGAIYNGSGNPTLVNCTFSGNSAEKGGGIFHDYMSSATMIDCVFTENSAGAGGGIYSYNHYGTLIVRACTFSANKAEGWGGGGMYNDSDSNSIVTNCIFIANLSERHGGGMYNWRSNTTITNCTFAQNLANNGNALACDSYLQQYPSNIVLTNCILWDGGDEIWNNDNSVISIAYSDVQNGLLGEGNIDSNPLFVDPGYWDANGTPNDANDDIWVDGDYHLLPDSPCIDAGDPNYVAEPNETDLDGRLRIIGGRIDMGAYEYSPPVPAEVKIVPQTINLASKGKWITCYICLPEQYNVADIDPPSILLEDEIKPEQFSVDEQSQVAIARFNRKDVQPILEEGEIELTITGQLVDGTVFEGTDVITVTDKKGKGKK